jgi:hypothetical protein
VSQVLESVSVAAPRGLVWRVVRDIAPDDNEPDVVQEGRELRWTTPVFVDAESAEHRVDMSWWVRLAPSWTGTEVEHGCAFPERPDLIASVRARLVSTLTDVKTRAEAESAQ